MIHIQTFAKQFEWNFRYAGADNKWGNDDDIVLNNRLVVPVGHPIVMEQTSLDVIHSFFLPNMRLKQDVVPGMQIKVWFQPTKTTKEMQLTRGNYVKPEVFKSEEEKAKEKITPPVPEPWTYEIVCAELCGMQHGEMRGTMQVLDQKEYDEWYKKASDDASNNEPPEVWKYWKVKNPDTGERDFPKRDIEVKKEHAEKKDEKKQ